MKKLLIPALLSGAILITCVSFFVIGSIPKSDLNQTENLSPAFPIPPCDGFDFPVGKPDANGYYDAQGFGTRRHLGEDWNGVRGGDSDLGDPVYSVADGLVVFCDDFGGGWGNVVRIVHNIGSDAKPIYVESVYAHLQKIYAVSNAFVARGDEIGKIGNAGGIYKAHLHFEIRTQLGMPIGEGYSLDTRGYTVPSEFIREHRPGKKSDQSE